MDDLMDRLQDEFVFLTEDCGVDGDKLGTMWALHTLLIISPNTRLDDLAQALQDYGWH